MKKFLLILVSITMVAVFVSCKKSSSSSDNSYYVKAKINGSLKNLTTIASAIKVNLGLGIYSLSIVGGSTTEQISIALWSDKDDFIAGKVFTKDTQVGSENTMGYVFPLGSSDPAKIWATLSMSGAPESFNCTITEATSTYIKGTFSGTLYQQIDNPASIVVTEGEFRVKY